MYSINNKLAVIVFLLLGNIAMAQQVTRQEAIKAATRIQVIEDELSASSISDVYTKVHNGDTLLFEVDFDNGGFVILSGNKFCEPVLGYGILSENCSLHGIINHYDEIPDGLRTFIDTYEAQIKSCFLQNNIVNQHTEWETLLNEPYTPTNQVRRVNPLLETKWGQSSSNNGWGHAYNYYVNSIDTNCHNCPAGCVPVAMAQILKYWEEPEENPSWCIQYDWDNMPDELIDDGSSLYVTQRNAVAKLIKDCGASVNVQYCPSGSGCQSGASISNAPNALQQFGFNEAEYKEKSSFSQNDWEEMLRDDLDMGYPVLYRGSTSPTVPGHAFVCDGYKKPLSSYKYHFNWGWCGAADGWFALTALTPHINNGTTSDYTQAQAAVFNIYPSSCWQNIIFECNTLLLQNTHDYHAIEKIQNDNHIFSIQYQATAIFKAGDEIILTDGFRVGNGGVFVAKIEACEPDDGNGMTNLEDGIGERALLGGRTQDGRTRCVPTDNGLTIYPNPTGGTLTVESASPIREIAVYDLSGRVMMTVGGNSTTQCTLNVTSLRNGIYLLRVMTDSGVETGRFAKN